MYGHFMTDRGKVRSVNEDAGGIFYNKTNQLLTIVADGMGGHQAGEVASQLAVSVAQQNWEAVDEFLTPVEVETWIHDVMEQMNKEVYEYSLENTAYEGMGTTIVMGVCLPDFVTIAHVGDSRCYLYKEDQFKQITEDHSLVNELIRSGQISKDDAEKHPRKNVLLRALGTEEALKADYQTIHLGEQQRLLFCSDGLTNKMTDEEIKMAIQSEADLPALTTELIDCANDRGGEDNISVAIVEHHNEVKVGESPC